MKLIIGLGNPGKKYDNTRHNMGFMAIDRLANRHQVSIDKKKFQGVYTKYKYKGEDIILLKPETYMNLSGNSLIEAMKFFKLKNEDILVLYDDMDLDLGRIRLRIKGSSGGHNGMKSIMSHIGQDFNRIRIGIGKDKNYEVVDYVLGHFSPLEMPLINDTLDKVCDAIECMIEDNFEKAMNLYNRS